MSSGLPATDAADAGHIYGGIELPDVTEVDWADLVTPGSALWHQVEACRRPVAAWVASVFANFNPPQE